jgi:hypothetical protein
VRPKGFWIPWCILTHHDVCKVIFVCCMQLSNLLFCIMMHPLLTIMGATKNHHITIIHKEKFAYALLLQLHACVCFILAPRTSLIWKESLSLIHCIFIRMIVEFHSL